MLNVDGTCAGKRSKRDRTLEELTDTNSHDWNFALIETESSSRHRA